MVSSRDGENLDADCAASAFLCLSNASNSKDASVSGSGTRCTSIAPKPRFGAAALVTRKHAGISGSHSTLFTRWNDIAERGVSSGKPRQFRDIVSGVFTPVLAKHSKSFSLIDCISVGVDRMQRNFEPMRKQVEAWQKSELTDVTAKVVIYEAFVEGRLEAPKHLARTVHDLYFEPKYEEFQPRTIWSLSNAFTSAFKELDPVPQFKATAKLGEFLEARFSQSF